MCNFVYKSYLHPHMNKKGLLVVSLITPRQFLRYSSSGCRTESASKPKPHLAIVSNVRRCKKLKRQKQHSYVWQLNTSKCGEYRNRFSSKYPSVSSRTPSSQIVWLTEFSYKYGLLGNGFTYSVDFSLTMFKL